MYDEIKTDYIYALHHIKAYQANTKTNQQVTDANLFDRLYYGNLNKDKSAYGQQVGENSANLFNDYDQQVT